MYSYLRWCVEEFMHDIAGDGYCSLAESIKDRYPELSASIAASMKGYGYEI
jgi:hypothetical protein